MGRIKQWVEMGVISAAYEQSHSRELSAVCCSVCCILSGPLLWGVLAVAIAMRWSFTNVPTHAVILAVLPAFLMVAVPIELSCASA